MDHPLPTPIKSRRYSPTATLCGPPSAAPLHRRREARVASLAPPSRTLPFFLFPRPPRGISHPTDRPAGQPSVRPLPARDYRPSTRNQLTGHPRPRSRLFLTLSLSVCLDLSCRLFLRGAPNTAASLARLRSLFLPLFIFSFFFFYYYFSLGKSRACVSATRCSLLVHVRD